ncbi:MAG: hypothetical protein GY798_32765 [Hyphomicrobiales bacterium]|nr:hypothetical protein [Hyphomicrobiales bacterium]
MRIRTVSLVAGAALVLSVSGAVLAQDPTPAELAETQVKVKIASGVIALGRAEKDPMMLVVGAKILSGLGTVDTGSASEDASPAFDVSQILGEAKALAGDSQYLLGEIAAVSTDRPERRSNRYCNWYENCGYSIVDPFACEWVQVCN